MSQIPVLEFEDSRVCESGSCRAFKVRDGRREMDVDVEVLNNKKGDLGLVRDQMWDRGKKIIGSIQGGDCLALVHDGACRWVRLAN